MDENSDDGDFRRILLIIEDAEDVLKSLKDIFFGNNEEEDSEDTEFI